MSTLPLHMPVRMSCTILQGATFRRAFRWLTAPCAVQNSNNGLLNACTREPLAPEDLTPVDLTGCTARMQIRRTVLAPDVLIELTTENGRIDLSQGDGWVGLELDEVTTKALVYDTQPPGWTTAIGHLEVVHPNGDVSRPVEIEFTLDPEVTR